MSANRDGLMNGARADSRMRRPRMRLIIACSVLLPGLLPGWSPVFTTSGSPLPAANAGTGVWSIVGVCANRPAAITDAPVPSAQRPAVVANQAVVLTADDATAAPAGPLSWRPSTDGLAAETPNVAPRFPNAQQAAQPVAGDEIPSVAFRFSGLPSAGGLTTPAPRLASAGPSERIGRAEPARRGGDSIIAAMQFCDEGAEFITVAKGRTTIVDLRIEVDRAEILDQKIADIAVQTPTRIVIAGREIGGTQLVLTIGGQQRVLNVSVELDLALLRELVRRRSPTSHVEMRSVNGIIALGGTVPDAETAEQIVELAAMVQGDPAKVRNQMSVAGVQQTLLRVTVAEVNKEALRELGVNWAIGGNDWSRDFFFANNLGQLNPTTFSSSGLANIETSRMVYSVGAVGNLASTNVTFGFPRAEMQFFLNALRQNGLARTLAEPNLVAISGQTATFLAGGEVPIPVAQGGATAGSITLVYKEFGVRLAFTPTVLAGQIVRLHVMSEVSEAVPAGQQATSGLPVFSFTTRRVESTIECGNGQTFAIAGLLNDQVRASANKIPGLGDLPILGTLFSSTSYQRSESEMVVLVTPQLVEPLDPQQVPPPPGTLTPDPNDFELFVLQQLEGSPIAVPDADRVPRDDLPVNTRLGERAGWPTSQLALRGPWGLAQCEED